MNTTELQVLPLNACRLHKLLLRPINQNGEGYMSLKNSIRQKGVLQPVVVRRESDEGGEFFTIVEGAHRYTACKDLGYTEIPASIKVMTDQEVLEAQIVANVQRIDTKPAEYSKHLIKILESDWTLTESILAEKLGRSGAWLKDRLKLANLAPGIDQLVDEGKINLANATALAQLDEAEQAHWVERAQTMTAPEFVPACDARRKQMAQDKRAGKDSTQAEFKLTEFLQKLSVIIAEMNNPQQVIQLLSTQGITNTQDAAVMVLKWVLSVDPITEAARRQKFEEAALAKKAEQEKAKEQRDAKKKAEAADRAARVELHGKCIEAHLSEAETAAKLAEFDLALAARKKEEAEATATK